MTFFDYQNTPYADAMRDDIGEASRHCWDFIANPGSWWTGAERVAMIAESRAALDCGACKELKSAVSPNGFKDKHESPEELKGVLPNAAVDAIHRIIVDQSRFTKKVISNFLDAGLTAEHYLELLGVSLLALSIDEFTRGLSLPLEALPTPVAGEPTQYRIPEDRLDRETAFVPMITVDGTTGNEADLWPKGKVADANNVVRALSAVPQVMREHFVLSNAHYWDYAQKFHLGTIDGRVLNRAQIELVATRVSSLNECFY